MDRHWTHEWRAAPFALMFFIGISLLTTVGAPKYVAIISLGLGFALGWSLRIPSSALPWLAGGYGLLLGLIAAAMGRPVPVALLTAVNLCLSVLLLSFVGRRLGLRALHTPADVLKLILLAGLAGIPVPVFTVINARLLGIDEQIGPVTAQAGLTAVVGVLVAGALVLSYAPGRLRLPALRGLELFALAGATIFLLLGVTLMDAQTIAGAAPLFLLVVVLGWLGLRFGPFYAAIGLTLATCWIALSVAYDSGVFVSETASITDAGLAAQVYLIVLAGGVLILSVYAVHVRAQDVAALQSAQLLSSALESASAQLYIKRYDDHLGEFVYVEVNEALAAVTDRTPDDFVGRTSAELYPPELAERFAAQDHEVRNTAQRQRYDTSTTVNGVTRHYTSVMFPLYEDGNRLMGVGGICLDRTEEHRREQLLQLVFAQSPTATARVTPNSGGEILEANRAFARLVGMSAPALQGRRVTQFLADASDAILPDGADSVRREVRLRRADGAELTVVATATIVDVPEPEHPFVLLILEDVTAARAAEAGLVHRATHDPLTDLLNRQALVERLAGLTSGGTVPAGVAVLCCDLDGFKQINDSLGHDTGDRVLLSMAGRVRAAVSTDDVVGRLGADEFVIVAAGRVSASTATALAQRVRQAVAEPLEMDGRTHAIHVSIGVAVSAGDANADDLLRQADVALTRAKDLGRDRIEVYRPELDRRVQLRIAMRDTLRTALSENRIEVHAQPLVDLESGHIVGAEALVRLRDLDGTLLPPAAFVPVAEESGLIVPLGFRVLDVALALRARWAIAGSPLEIAVNVSPRQLADADFATTIGTLLQAHGVPADQLVLEVTESTVVDAMSPTLDMLGALRESGVHVAIDDFGTGYSSLTSLRDLPADVVKIDRSFVSGLLDDEGDEAIVRAVLAMAHATHRVVVAEGVETAEQAARLRALGCDRVQGFHFAPPLSPTDFDPRRSYPVAGGVPAPRLQG